MVEAENMNLYKEKNCIVDPSAKIGANFTFGHFVVIAADVVIGDNVTFGDYVKIEKGSIIGSGVSFGDYVKLMPLSRIGNNVKFDDYCNTSGYCSIGNNVVVKRQTMIGQATTIEDNVWLGSNVTTNRLKYPVMDRSQEKEEGVLIKTGCMIGSKALILAGVTLAEGTWISSGGVVTKDTESGFVYLGNPARKMSEVPAEYSLLPKK